MKNQTLLIAAAALAIYLLWKKNKSAAAPAMQTADLAIEPNLELVKSQTVNFPQIAPTPSTIMDMPGSANNPYQDACGCQNRQVGKIPYIC